MRELGYPAIVRCTSPLADQQLNEHFLLVVGYGEEGVDIVDFPFDPYHMSSLEFGRRFLGEALLLSTDGVVLPSSEFTKYLLAGMLLLLYMLLSATLYRSAKAKQEEPDMS